MRPFLPPAKWLLFLASGFLLLFFLIALSDSWIREATSDCHTGLLDLVPHRKTALVLGCSEYLRSGRFNPYFLHRIDAAAELYHAKKCEYLIVSGDNHKEDYNEPKAMRRALVNRGVPESQIYSDFAGFRTLDSVVRAKEVFAQDAFIVVSQQFHNERAIFIGQQKDIQLFGFNASDVKPAAHTKTLIRENFARVKTLMDLFITSKEPRFQGPRVALKK